MSQSQRVGKITLTRPDGQKMYFGGVFKLPTSFPGNGSVGLAVFADGDEAFDRVVEVVTESGKRIALDGYLNISAKL